MRQFDPPLNPPSVPFCPSLHRRPMPPNGWAVLVGWGWGWGGADEGRLVGRGRRTGAPPVTPAWPRSGREQGREVTVVGGVVGRVGREGWGGRGGVGDPPGRPVLQMYTGVCL